MRSRATALIGIIAVVGLGGAVGGQSPGGDWPQSRGPNRDGTLTTFAAPSAWPEQLTLSQRGERVSENGPYVSRAGTPR